MFVGELPDQEVGKAHHGNGGASHHHGRLEPIVLLTHVEHDLHGRDPHHQQAQTNRINRQRFARRVAVAEDGPGGHNRRHAHGDVDVENPRPGHVVGDPTTQQGAHHRCDQGRHRPERHGRTRHGTRVTGQQQGLRQRNHRPSHKALQDTEGDQHFHIGRQTAQPRRDHKQHHAEHEQPHLAKAHRQPPSQRHRYGIGHRKTGDDPSTLVGADAQVTRYGGQRHVGNRRVQHIHKHRRRQRDRANQALRAF